MSGAAFTEQAAEGTGEPKAVQAAEGEEAGSPCGSPRPGCAPSPLPLLPQFPQLG